MPLPAVAFALTLAVLAPARAEAGFSSQLVSLSGPEPAPFLADVEVDDAGQAFVLWLSQRPSDTILLRGRRVQPSGVLGEVLTLSDGTQSVNTAAVAFLPDGSVFVVWTEALGFDPHFLRGRRVAPNDEMDQQMTLRNAGSSSDAGNVTVAGRTDGGVTVAWHNHASSPGPARKVETRNVTAAGVLGALREAVPPTFSLDVGVVPDLSAGALLLWTHLPNVTAQRIGADDALGTSMPATTTSSGSAVIAGRGHGAFQSVWRVGNGPYSLVGRRLGADGAAAGDEVTLDAPGPTFVGEVFVAANDAGRALVGWYRSIGTREVVKARFIGSDGVPEAETFTAPDATLTQQGGDVGIGGSGAGAIGWHLGTIPDVSVWGRILPASGSPPAPVQLSPPGTIGFRPRVKIGAADVGVVVWGAFDGQVNEVVARQILPPPVCADANATVVQGRPTAVHLGCSGLQLTTPEVIGPPAHGTVSAVDVVSHDVVYTPVVGFEGTDTFTFRGVNAGGVGEPRTATIAVGRDTVPPVITRFAISNQRLVAPRGVVAAAKKKGEKFAAAGVSLEYSEVGTAVVTIEKVRRCPKRSRRCTPFTAIGTVEATTPGTSAAVSLATVGARKGRAKVRPGRYRATAVVTDLAGNRSETAELTFKVVRR